MRFYDVTAGRITLDGVDIASMPRSALRDQIGMVLQDTWLFEGTIRDNIAYGRPGATEDEILEAARATYVDRFVHSLPDGYDTHLEEDGTNLSAGERQLVTIARAFLSDPELLILDEATSSVDTRTELLLQHAMAALRTDRTSFVIAHRLSTIRDADLILVMEDGAIVEQGTHDSLLDGGRRLRAAVQRAVRGAGGERGRLSAATALPSRSPVTQASSPSTVPHGRDQARGVGQGRGLGAGRGVQLGQDARHVDAGRLGRDEQPGADRAVGGAGGDQAQHLALALGQRGVDATGAGTEVRPGRDGTRRACWASRPGLGLRCAERTAAASSRGRRP